MAEYCLRLIILDEMIHLAMALVLLGQKVP